MENNITSARVGNNICIEVRKFMCKFEPEPLVFKSESIILLGCESRRDKFVYNLMITKQGLHQIMIFPISGEMHVKTLLVTC